MSIGFARPASGPTYCVPPPPTVAQARATVKSREGLDMLQPERRASRAAHFVSILKAPPPFIVVLEESQAEDSRLPSGDQALEDSKGDAI